MNGLLTLAFTAGMLAPANPCGFALLPAWITYTLGETDTSPLPVRLARATRTGTALTLGFTATLTAAGLAVSAGARPLIKAAPWLGLGIGIILLALGALMLTGRTFGLRMPAARRRPTAGPPTAPRMLAFGIGYAAASLSCTFGVLLAVIAQAQATANFAGQLAVFAAYAAGSATVLLLVTICTAAAGAALTRRITALARHGARITAAVLILTGAYLAWYWYPAATGGPADSRATGTTRVSATVSTWIQAHQGIVVTLTAVALIAVAATVLRHRLHTRAPGGQAATPDAPAPPVDCCSPEEPAQPGPAGRTLA